MKQLHHNNIPVTIYAPKEAKMFDAAILFISGNCYKKVATKMGITLNKAYEAEKWLKDRGEI